MGGLVTAWMWWVAAIAGAASPEVGVCGYRAVLFAAQNYDHDSVSDLGTPNRDIEAIAEVLRERYGFSTETFPDASRELILDRLDRLRAEARDCEAVLVYYAGHGQLDEGLNEGFWLPADARADSTANWISNDDVASRLRALPALHVLLIADSCFAGKLFRGLETLPSGGTDPQARATRLARRQSRMVLTSGGEELVADAYLDSGMSVFAYFLRQALQDAPRRYVSPEQWFSTLRDRVMDNATQQPQLGRLFGAGHEGGALVMVNEGGAVSEATAEPLGERSVSPAPDDMLVDQDGIEWVPVPGGTFRMGAPAAETDARMDERPTRQMSVARRWVMRREVTRAQWAEVMGTRPSASTECGEACPVDSISWFDAVAFANALSVRHGLKPVYRIKGSKVMWRPRRSGYRLLTEAEWEHAAGGGQAHRFAGSERAGTVAWTSDNSGARPHVGCSRAPNGFGLCDMSGGLQEWVWDWYDPDTYVELPAETGRGPDTGTLRVLRGGSFRTGVEAARVVARASAEPDLAEADVGVRLVRPE